MGVLEAALLGAVGGGSVAVVAALLLGRTARGRSSASVTLPGRMAVQVLQLAHAYFAQQGMGVQAMAGGLLARAGSEYVAGARVIELRVRDGPNGAEVYVDAYLRGFYPKEVNLDPHGYFAMLPRRKAREIAEGLLGTLGARDAAWQHRRAS